MELSCPLGTTRGVPQEKSFQNVHWFKKSKTVAQKVFSMTVKDFLVQVHNGVGLSEKKSESDVNEHENKTKNKNVDEFLTKVKTHRHKGVKTGLFTRKRA